MTELSGLSDWSYRDILVGGRRCKQHRRTCSFSKHAHLNFRYSGTDNFGGVFPPALVDIERRICEVGLSVSLCRVD